MMKKERLTEILTKFLMFSLSSGVGTLVDLGVHWILSSTLFSGSYWGKLWISPLISFELASLTNFVIAYNLVWRERISVRNRRSFLRHLAAYNATCTGAFLVKFAVMQGVHFLFVSLNWFQGASYEPVLCNLISLCVSGGINFYMSEWVIFRKKKK